VVVVAPAERRQGVGSTLWNALQPYLVERRPAHLRANGDPNDPESVAWAQRRGFVITQHLVNQQLDLAGWEPAPQPLEGFTFVPYTAVAGADSDRRLHALYQEYLSHTPDAAEAPYMEFEPWRAWAFESEGAWPDGWIIAVAPNGDWAGFSLMQKHGGSSAGAHVFMTGVSPAYRGHGLGLALKIAATSHAARSGITHLTTLNHGANERILAINRKLGFYTTQAIYRMVANWSPHTDIIS
jgi:GNAT superfamily N-acetyltransferase